MARAIGKNAEFPSFSNYWDYPAVAWFIMLYIQRLNRLNAPTLKYFAKYKQENLVSLSSDKASLFIENK